MGKKYKDKKWLEEKYVDAGKTLKEISDICEVNVSTIHRWMKKEGVQRRSIDKIQLKRYGKNKKYRNKEWLLDKYIDKNMTTSEIGKLSEVSKTTILRWLKEFDIETRDNKPRERKKKVQCDWCKKEILKHLSSLKEYDYHFCSRSCLHKWKSKNDKGANNPLWEGGKKEVRCEYCNKIYKVTPSREETSRFCSRKCYERWQSENLSGENSYQWRGGYNEYIEKRINADGNWRRNRKKALNRDEHECQFCSSKENLEVHHIVPVRDDGTNNIGNLITLCSACHSRTERDCSISTEM